MQDNYNCRIVEQQYLAEAFGSIQHTNTLNHQCDGHMLQLHYG